MAKQLGDRTTWSAHGTARKGGHRDAWDPEDYDEKHAFVFFIVAAFVIVSNFVVDLAYGWIDPRISVDD